VTFESQFYAISIGSSKDLKISFKNRLPVNNHDCHIYCQSIESADMIVIYSFIISWNHHCVYGSHQSLLLFIQHLNICIKVFKAKCGDKIYMWVMVFLQLEDVSTTVAY
jgi:hypothetical protein